MAKRTPMWMICCHEGKEGRLKPYANRAAPTAREALKAYFAETLKGYGWTRPSVKGDTMTVRDTLGNKLVYTAVKL